MKRLVKIGEYLTGEKNNICDVPGVLVGHTTISEGSLHTGITAILPHKGNMYTEKVSAGCCAFNGYGKSIGLMQIDELGEIETPILLTNTLSAGRISDGLIDYMINDNPGIAVTTSTVNPIVLECNDGSISEIQKRIFTKEHVYDAIKNAENDFIEGSIGAGCGMKCHGFKGGIGSSSRIIEIDSKKYTIGVLVNSNFGSSNGKDLIFKGRALGGLIANYNLKQEEDKGSIITIIATDLPLNQRQLERISLRAELGIARTGSYAGHGSGDITVAFSTVNTIKHYTDFALDTVERFSNNYINKVFQAVVDAVEEAVLNSMLHSEGMMSYNGIYYKSLNEYHELFEDLLEK